MLFGGTLLGAHGTLLDIGPNLPQRGEEGPVLNFGSLLLSSKWLKPET